MSKHLPINNNPRLKTLSAPLQQIMTQVADGRPLYLYRISYSQFEELQRYLTQYNALVSRLINTKRYAQELDKAFVLYASEWWRRKYDGNWGWSDLLASININHDHINGQALLYFTERGLKKWQRDISRTDINHRSALGSFLREGGLPVHYFNTSGGWLDLLHGALIERARFDNARQYFERNSYRLPKTAGQQVMLDTLEALVNDIHQLVSDNNLGAQADPIAYLDKQMTNWQDQFPFSLEYDTARNFLTRLIVDSVNSIKQHSQTDAESDNWYNSIQLQRFLMIPLNEYPNKPIQLTASIVPPSFLPLSKNNIEVITDDLINLEFYQQSNESPLTQWYAEPVYKQERLKFIDATTLKLKPEQWGSAISLHLSDSLGKTIKGLTDSEGNTFNPYQNASMYGVDSNTPFLASIQLDESGFIKALYQGSYHQSVKEEAAIVYVPTGWQTHYEDNSELLMLAGIQTAVLYGRLYRLTGVVVISNHGDKHKFKTSSMDASFYYAISGRKLVDFVYPNLVIKGDFKVLKIDKMGVSKPDGVLKHSIWLAEVNEDGTSSQYHSLAHLKSTPIGCYRLQVRDDSGNTLFKTMIGLVPKDFRYRLRTEKPVAGHARGMIDCQTAQAVQLNDHAPPSLHCTEQAEKNTFQIMVDKVPNDKVTLGLSFLVPNPHQAIAQPSTKALRFRCYFPSTQTVIYDHQGNEYGNHTLHLNIDDELAGYRIKVFNPNRHRTLEIEFSLKSEPDVYIVKNYTVDANKFLALKPVNWQPIILRLLRLSKYGLDDVVKVRLIMSSRPQFEISFGYYNYQLSVDRPNNVIVLKAMNDSASQTAKGLCDSITLKALNFSDPAQPLIELNRYAVSSNSDSTLDSLNNDDAQMSLTLADTPQNTVGDTLSNEYVLTDDVLCVWRTDSLLDAPSGTYLVFAEPADIDDDPNENINNNLDSFDSHTGVSINNEVHNHIGNAIDSHADADSEQVLLSKSIRSTVYHISERITLNDNTMDSIETVEPSDDSFANASDANDIFDADAEDSVSQHTQLKQDDISEAVKDEPALVVTLAIASHIANQQQRLETMRTIYRQMAFDTKHTDWQYLKTITTNCLHLPLITLDNWLAARQVPEFISALVIYGDDILGKQVVDKVKREIGFVWEIVAFEDFKQHWQRFAQMTDSNLQIITDDTLRQDLIKSRLVQRQKELSQLSAVFDCWFNALQSDNLGYKLDMMTYLLQINFTGIVAQKQQLDVKWPVNEDMIDIVNSIFKLIPTDCKVTFNIPYRYMQTVALLPIVMAWMSVQPSHAILYQYGKKGQALDASTDSEVFDVDVKGDTATLNMNQLNKLKRLRKRLREHSAAIYQIKQFAPIWYNETFSLAFGWFEYCAKDTASVTNTQTNTYQPE